MKRNTIRDEIMLAVPAVGNSGLTREEVINEVMWRMNQPLAQGLNQTPKRKSIVDKLKRMIRDCEITEWSSGGITQNP